MYETVLNSIKTLIRYRKVTLKYFSIKKNMMTTEKIYLFDKHFVSDRHFTTDTNLNCLKFQVFPCLIKISTSKFF